MVAHDLDIKYRSCLAQFLRNEHANLRVPVRVVELRLIQIPNSKVHGANMGPTWGHQDPGGPHVGPMEIANWDRWHPPGNDNALSCGVFWLHIVVFKGNGEIHITNIYSCLYRWACFSMESLAYCSSRTLYSMASEMIYVCPEMPTLMNLLIIVSSRMVRKRQTNSFIENIYPSDYWTIWYQNCNQLTTYLPSNL